MAVTCESNPIAWEQLVTWVMVLVGWFIVHRSTLLRERRKDKRESAKELLKELGVLETEAIFFHTSDIFDENTSLNLRMRTDRLIKRLQRPPLSELSIQYPLLIALRQSISRQNIDRSDFKKQTDDSMLLREIRSATDDLIDAIDAAKERAWP